MIQVPCVPKRSRLRSRLLMGWAVVALACLGVWLRLAPEGNPERHEGPAPEGEPAGDSDETQAQAPVPAAAPRALLARPLLAPPANEMAPSGAPAMRVVGPGPDDPHEAGMVPHPLDAARARIQAENHLIQSLNDAMSFRKVQEMRAMLADYRRLDPNDVDASQLGYEVIADCIEFPGNASLTAAREFYDKQRHSSLRRFVRRICFENGN